MKNLALLFGGFVALFAQTLPAALYSYEGPLYGQDNSPILSGGKLDLSNGTTGTRPLSGVFHMGSGFFNSDTSLIFYIDSVPGGYTDTSAFNRTAASDWVNTVSGYRNPPSLVTFPAGFAADYALVLRPIEGSARLAQLTPEGIIFGERNLNSTPYSTGQRDLDFTIWWSALGLADNQPGNSLKFVSTYVTTSGTRFNESLETYTLSGNSITFTSFDVFPDVPEPTNAALACFGAAAAGSLIWRSKRPKP